MRSVLAAILCLAGVPAHAAVLTCHFTEPFFSITFDSATGKVVQSSADVTDPATGEPAPTVLAEQATLRLVEEWQNSPRALLESGGDTLLELRMVRGSDGMSERIYPMEGVRGSNVGGCATNTVLAFDQYQLFTDLGIRY